MTHLQIEQYDLYEVSLLYSRVDIECIAFKLQQRSVCLNPIFKNSINGGWFHLRDQHNK